MAPLSRSRDPGLTKDEDAAGAPLSRSRDLTKDEVPRFICGCAVTTCTVFQVETRCRRLGCPQKLARHSEGEQSICATRPLNPDEPQLRLYCSMEEESQDHQIAEACTPSKWLQLHSTDWKKNKKSISFEKPHHVTEAQSYRALVGRKVYDQGEEEGARMRTRVGARGGHARVSTCANTRVFACACVLVRACLRDKACVCVCLAAPCCGK